MKLTKKLPNGKFKVNKAAVIARLRKSLKAKHKALALGVIHVSDREVASVAEELTRYNADSLLNTSEE
jgi:ferric-dicitrate binding protein FerR (iron transport regulator)